MNDDELRRVLQNALGGRRAPEEVRARVLSRLRRRPALLWAAAAAAAVSLAVGLTLLLRPRPTPPLIEAAFQQHSRGLVDEHAAGARTPRELAEITFEALGQSVQVPALRDAGFSPIQAHRCPPTGWVHVIYANHWLKLSCFMVDAAKAALPRGGRRVVHAGVETEVYERGALSAVAVRDGNVLKVWVADLRRDQLAAVAGDAELKRSQVRRVVLTVPGASLRPVEAILLGTVGVEDVWPEASRGEVSVLYDGRRVSLNEIEAVLALNGFEATSLGRDGR